MRRHPREDPQLLSRERLLCPRQCKASIVKKEDDRESALSFSLSSTQGLFRIGLISFIEVAEEAVLEGLVTVTGGVTETPFSTTYTILFPMLERALFFLPFIFTYIPWLNLVVIPAAKHLLKKKQKQKQKKKNKRERKKQKGAALTNSFSLRFRCSVGQKQKVLDPGNGRLESAGQPNR